jgi:hypothetical protein
VRDVEDSLRRRRAEAREDVAQRQVLAVHGAVRPPLLDHRVGARLHHCHDPVAGLLGMRRTGDARSEGELLARVRQRRIADEGGLGAHGEAIARGERRQRGEGEQERPREGLLV